MIMLMFHFKGLFRHLLQETKETVTADIPELKHHVYHPTTFCI